MSISRRSLPCAPACLAACLGALAFALLMLGAVDAAAAPAPETPNATFAASSSAVGELADGAGAVEYTPVGISADGRYVAFQSAAQNLGEAGPAGAVEGFVKDLDTGEVRLVSRADGVGGEPAAAPGITTLALSADGRHVLFTSAATNLGTALPGEEGGETHVYERDLDSGETTLVDRVSGADGVILARGAEGDSISADGSVVAFTDRVSNLEDPLGDHSETATAVGYVRDLAAATTTAISRASGAAGELANEDAAQLSISADGRFVSFESRASNLVAGVSEGWEQVYLRDLDAATTTLLSGNALGEAGEGNSATATISGAAGCFVEFSSTAGNLLLPSTTPANGEQAYLADRCSGPPTISLLSITTGGSLAGIGQASFASSGVRDDGSAAVFMAQFGAFGCCHLYLREVGAGTTAQLDRATGEAGAVADGELEFFAISANGCRGVFESRATNLVAEAAPDPGEEPTQVYVRQLAPCAEAGGGGGAPGSGVGSAGSPSATSGPPVVGPAKIATVRSLKVVGGRIVAAVDAPATFAVRIRRLIVASHRHWRLVRMTSIAIGAGQTKLPLPSFPPGTYRLNIHLDGTPEGESFVRRLTVPGRGRP